jgi:hypothetical protein
MGTRVFWALSRDFRAQNPPEITRFPWSRPAALVVACGRASCAGSLGTQLARSCAGANTGTTFIADCKENIQIDRPVSARTGAVRVLRARTTGAASCVLGAGGGVCMCIASRIAYCHCQSTQHSTIYRYIPHTTASTPRGAPEAPHKILARLRRCPPVRHTGLVLVGT